MKILNSFVRLYTTINLSISVSHLMSFCFPVMNFYVNVLVLEYKYFV